MTRLRTGPTSQVLGPWACGRLRGRALSTLAFAITLAGSVWGPGSVRAEAGPFGEPVEEMVVVGEARPGLDVLAGATTTRIETDQRLIEGAQIDDLLAEVPGLQIRRFGGIGERFEISIRGSTPEQVPVFLDGVRLDSSLTGRSDLSTICLDVLEEIQVTRGAGAARAGSGAIGGVVNLVSRRPPEDPETRVRLSGGNFGTIEGSVRHARRFKKWDLSLSYCGFHTDGDFKFRTAVPFVQGMPIGSSSTETRTNNEANRHTTLAQIGRSLGPGHLKLTQLVSHLDRGTPGDDRAPSNFADENDLSILTSTVFNSPITSFPKGRLRASMSHRFERNDFNDPETGPARNSIDIETTVHNLTARSILNFELDGLGASHEISFLAEGLFDTRGANEANRKSRAGVALRAEATSGWLDDRLRIAPSLRFERYEGLNEEWIPGLFIEGLPFEWLTLKGSASRSYRVPSFQELFLPDKGFQRGNENLRPEKAWNFELGGVIRSPFESPWLDGEIEATWFAGEVDETIVFELISSGVVSPVNTGPTKTRGFEVTLRWRPHPWVRLTAARTVTQTKVQSSKRNQVGIAVSQIDGRVELGPRDRFKVVCEIHYTGRIPLDSGGLSLLESRVAYDLSASADLSKIPVPGLPKLGRSLWLSVRGRNLADVSIRDSRSFPQPGRNFSVALESVF
jgi:outer membrane receptor protein involved in Fe transport